MRAVLVARALGSWSFAGFFTLATVTYLNSAIEKNFQSERAFLAADENEAPRPEPLTRPPDFKPVFPLDDFLETHREWKDYFERKIVHWEHGPPFAYFDPRIGKVHLLIFDRNENYRVSGNCRCSDDKGKRLGPRRGKNPAEFPNYRVDMKFNALCGCGGRESEARRVSVEWDADAPDPERGKSDGVPSLPYNVPIIPIPPKNKEWQANTVVNYELALCAAPIFGPGPHWAQLLQWVEVHRALGAGKFFLYYLHTDDEATKALLYHYQVVEAVVEVVPLTPLDSDCAGDHYCRHDYQVQDCVLRARAYGYRYAAPLDIDELLIPKGLEDLTQFVRRIAHNDGHSYTIRPRWVFKDVPESPFPAMPPSEVDQDHLNALLTGSLPIDRFHSITQIASQNDTVKSVVDTEKALYMGVHEMLRATEGSRQYQIGPEEAYVRHYRKIEGWPAYEEKLERYGPLSRDALPPRFLSKVHTSARRVLKRVNALLAIE